MNTMHWKNWQDMTKKFLTCSSFFIESFHILTITLLGLLLPLSFLLLARLFCCDHLLLPSSFLFWLFRYTNLVIIYFLISILSVATLIHSLTGKPTKTYRLIVYKAWIILCTSQICVGMGMEATIANGIYMSSSNDRRSLFGRTIFFLGLHETMFYWSRTVVKPVVDDIVFGEARDERMVQRAVAAASFGGLWWWRLREEVEFVILTAESKKELVMGSRLGYFVGSRVYYLTVTIGVVSIVKGLFWFVKVLLCKRVWICLNGSCNDTPVIEDNI